jgi:class 3 adenylate cyclase
MAPPRATHCAVAMVADVRPLGLEIRAGVHTGEVEHAGSDIQGLAVHIGARVAALAGPSKVFVSSTVKDLTAGSGLVFENAGEHELKGVPDRWRLWRVVGAGWRHPPTPERAGFPVLRSGRVESPGRRRFRFPIPDSPAGP